MWPKNVITQIRQRPYNLISILDKEVTDADQPRVALMKFVDFLENLTTDLEETKDKIVLVAHNNKKFDSNVLAKNFARVGFSLLS